MIKAKEAAQITRDSIKSDIGDIEKLIRKEASLGRNKLYWYKFMKESDRDILYNHGYTVKNNSHRDDYFYLIEW